MSEQNVQVTQADREAAVPARRQPQPEPDHKREGTAQLWREPPSLAGEANVERVALLDAGHRLALAAGKLNMATDGCLLTERTEVLNALKQWSAALATLERTTDAG